MIKTNHSSKNKNVKFRVLLLSIILFSAGFSYGFITHRHKLLPYYVIKSVFQQSGRSEESQEPQINTMWAPAPKSHLQREDSEELAARMSQLAALGYSSGYKPMPNDTGVLVFNRELAYHGYNYYTSGHAPEAVLMDMMGKVLHKWRYEFRDVWPESDTKKRKTPGFWRRTHLFDNGDLLAIYDYRGLIKIDKNSNFIWSYPNCHHDLQVVENDSIYVLTAQVTSKSALRDGEPVVEDFITVLDSNGKLIRSVSILDAFLNSMYAPLLYSAETERDLLHTNTIEVLDGRLEGHSPTFKAGNVLISSRNIDAIAVIDVDLQKVVWALYGMWKKQHQPTILSNGNMLLFDNEGHRGFSKVIEFNPFTQAILWSYQGNDTNGFFTATMGSNQRLPNGNTLITDSTSGRAFEVTPDNEIVWEFLNPRRSGDDDELIAVICEMVRIRSDFPLDWLP